MARVVRSAAAAIGLTSALALPAACSGSDSVSPASDAGPDLSDWDRAITRPGDATAAASRAACNYARGALPGETLGESTPVDSDIPLDVIVVLMQENRSFDSYFSHLGKYAGRTDIESASDSTLLPATIGAAPSHALAHADHLCAFDTNHEWAGTHLEYDDGKMDGFWQANTDWGTPPPNAPASASDPARALWWYDERDLPFYYALAATFAIDDHYFSSILGPTWPNRDYLYMATSRGVVGEKLPDTAYDQDVTHYATIFDELEKRHVAWNVYADDLPPEAVAVGPLLQTRWGRSPLLHVQDFLDEAAAGTLPSVVFLDANFGHDGPARDDEHPPADIQVGQKFVSDAVHALFASPQWPRSALFLVYDEHGGYYDHVAPPAACAPDPIPPALDPGDATKGGFDRLGMRVPFVVVSPFARRGFVSHEVHDHTSITRFIEARWRLPALTSRDANADPPMEMFDFQHPTPAPPKLDVPAVDATELAWCVKAYGP